MQWRRNRIYNDPGCDEHHYCRSNDKGLSGNYVGDVNINKANITLQGSGIDVSTITGPYNAGSAYTL